MKKSKTLFSTKLSPLKWSILSLFTLAYLATIAARAPFFTSISTLDLTQISSLISGPSLSPQSGVDVSSVGDFNSDGFPDIIISAKKHSSNAGIVYVIFGTSNGIESIDLQTEDLYTSNRGFKIIGASSNFYLGVSVASAGDFNHDGIDDIIIGAPGFSAYTGKVYIIFGRSSGSTDIDLSIDDIIALQRGLIITGDSGGVYGGECGHTVSRAGDVNKDGIDDVIVSSYTTTQIGVAYVIFGGKYGYANFDLSTVDLSTSGLGFKIIGVSAAAAFSISVSNAGDFNNDGIDDIVIGSNGRSTQTGAAYVVFGSKTVHSDIDLNSGTLFSSGRGFIITGESSVDSFGVSVASAGDINKDGVDDIIIGARGAASNLGSVYIIYGHSSPFTNIDLSSVDLSASKRGFKIIGASAGDLIGSSVSGTGDVNNDGIDDVIIGATRCRTDTSTVYGAQVVYVIFGQKDRFTDIHLGTVDLSASRMGFDITGSSSDMLGYSVRAGRDLNKDGVGDIIIGSQSAAIVILGRDTIGRSHTTSGIYLFILCSY